jgi:hypothetical protein
MAALRKSQREKLSAALQELPPHLAYLRQPVLDAATQDQELLACGAGDPGSFEQAWKRRVVEAAVDDVAELAAAEARDFRDWLEREGDNNAGWLSPAYWVEGLLLGIGMFASSGDEAEAEIPKHLQPCPFDIDVPPGMKATRDGSGVVIKGRHVLITVADPALPVGMSVEEFERQLRNPPKAELPEQFRQPPEFSHEFLEGVRFGSISGFGTTSSYEGRTFAAMYMLKLEDGGYVGVRIVEKSPGSGKKWSPPRGLDLGMFTPMLASIRRAKITMVEQ